MTARLQNIFTRTFTDIITNKFVSSWLLAASFVGVHVISDIRANTIEEEMRNLDNPITIIYQKPFCPIGHVINYAKMPINTDIELRSPDAGGNKITRWVIPSPFGNHKIIYYNVNTDTQTVGYYSCFYATKVFPLSKVMPQHKNN